MRDGSSQTAFEEWLGSLGVTADSPPAAVSWLRRYFDRHGPVSEEVVLAAHQAEYVTTAESTLETVLGDLRATTSAVWTVTIDSDVDDGVHLLVDGYLFSSLHGAVDEHGMLQEVADLVQDLVMSDHATVWPTCSQHGSGLHADLIDEVAVWQCRLGRHTVAPVGRLVAAGGDRVPMPPRESVADRLQDLTTQAIHRIGWTGLPVTRSELDEGWVSFTVGDSTDVSFFSPLAALALPDEVIVVATVDALRIGGADCEVFLAGLSEEWWLEQTSNDT